MLYNVPMCAIHVPLSFTIPSVGCILGCTVDLNQLYKCVKCCENVPFSHMNV